MAGLSGRRLTTRVSYGPIGQARGPNTGLAIGPATDPSSSLFYFEFAQYQKIGVIFMASLGRTSEDYITTRDPHSFTSYIAV